ncbi:MAG TPA: flagellar basal-body MS-ring/collar protein FliF [Kofleriaceae bacterium]|nr:flagellar basal-body MS-ring/collar protein FliF [Kofleriaceae bacterium]
MATSPKQIGAQALGVWQKLTLGRRVAAVAVVAGVAAVLYFASRGGPEPVYAPLYTGLTPQDAGEIAAELQAQAIPYRLGAGGSVVEVPAVDVARVRMAMASAGLPRAGGVGFEIFDEQKFGTSSFVEQVNYRRALQGELSRSIAALDAVDSARVHLAMGRRSVFRDADEPPSASVALKLARGRELGRAQVQGIVHLVSSSVDGLGADRVVVIDERGTVLSSGDDSSAGQEANTELETSLTRRVREMVERVVGAGHASVVVTAEMDQHKVDETEELYDRDKTALRSESRTIEGSAADLGVIGGVAGARGNLPGAPSPVATPPLPVVPAPTGGGSGQIQHLQETKNWEVNRVVRRTIGPDAQIKRLHVAVLVDNKSAAKAGDPPVARSTEELEHIAAVVREAAGLDTERGDRLEVRNVPFSPTPDEAAEGAAAAASPPAWQQPSVLAAAGGGALIVIFALFMVMRRKRQRTGAPRPSLMLPAAVGALEAALNQNELAAGRPADAQRMALAERAIYERVVDVVRTEPARAARVLSAWLAEEPRKTP